MEISCVYFMFANKAEFNIELTHQKDLEESVVVEMAKQKALKEMGIDIDLLANKIGKNISSSHGNWYFVDTVDIL